MVMAGHATFQQVVENVNLEEEEPRENAVDKAEDASSKLRPSDKAR